MLSLSLSPSARRPAVLAIILFGVILLLTDLWGVTHSRLLPVAWTPSPPATTDPAVSKNLRVLRSQCNAPDPFELTYGRTNLRMTRAYEGA
jgi:hypothetical protein